MKPIFEKEREFLRLQGVEIPANCWRDGTKIYLNADTNTLIIRFKVENKKIIIVKNKLKEIEEKYKNKTFEEEVEENRGRLEKLLKNDIDKMVKCINKYPDNEFRLSDSGGKDSLVTRYVFEKACEITNKYDYVMDICNTTNDTADTYKTVKQNIKDTLSFQYYIKNKKDITQEELDKQFKEVMLEWIHTPEIGYYTWIEKVKRYYTPSVTVRNCCSTYKEGQINKILDKNKNYVQVLGMRRAESVKRQNYDYYLNDAMLKFYNHYEILYKSETDEFLKNTYRKKMNKHKPNAPLNWVKYLPVVDLTDKDVWLIILMKKLRFNPMYEMGFQRVGCLICPYGSAYTDLLIKHYYPSCWIRWSKILEKNYELYNIKNRLKWSKDEYIEEGKWKEATSKENEILAKKPTKERIKEIAEIKGISEEMAEKFFIKKCSCGKKLNPDEKAMFYKLFGRYEGKEDNRDVLCRDCVCKIYGWTNKEYAEKVREYREGGCNLF